MEDLLFRRPEPRDRALELAAKYSALSQNIENVLRVMTYNSYKLQQHQLSCTNREKVAVVISCIQDLKSFSEKCMGHSRDLLCGIPLPLDEWNSLKCEVKKQMIDVSLNDKDPLINLLHGAEQLQILGNEAIPWFRTPALIDLFVIADVEEIMRIVGELRSS